MSADREVLLELLDAVERGGDALPRAVVRARHHVAATRPHDCTDAVERASRAAYAAGQARQAGAHP